MVGRRDARHTDANIAALSDNDCDTLQFTSKLLQNCENTSNKYNNNNDTNNLTIMLLIF